jgi:hypothetical protein
VRLTIFIILLTTATFSCGKKEKESVAEQSAQQTTAEDSVSAMPPDSVAIPPAAYTYQIIPAPENTFGYDVYKDAKLFIHQPHIPGMPGVKGFAKEEQAKKAAELMIEKMNKGVVPPTLTEEEIGEILAN